MHVTVTDEYAYLPVDFAECEHIVERLGFDAGFIDIYELFFANVFHFLRRRLGFRYAVFRLSVRQGVCLQVGDFGFQALCA